jgi:hypothetical protein
MAKAKGGIVKTSYVPGKPKKTRQGNSKNTIHAKSSRNNGTKKYRGQGR